MRCSQKVLSQAKVLLAAFVMGRAQADSTVVFNEIMYHPAAAETSMEWIEFYNQMAVTMDLSGWSVAGGVQFTFLEGTLLPGGGHLIVALNPAELTAATGATNVFGPFLGRLSNSGERLELRNNNQRLMDEVTYGTDGEWPVAADGAGVSLAKRSFNLASAPAQNWRMSAQIGGTPGAANFPSAANIPAITLITTTQEWRFHNAGVDLETAWRIPTFDDSGWSHATAPFYGGTAPAPGGDVRPIPTLFNTGIGTTGLALANPDSALVPVRPTTYFRTRFTFDGRPEATRLLLRAAVDDGAVFYLNGTEVLRLNLPTGPVSFSTAAVTPVANPPAQTSVVLSSNALHRGTNVLTAELHQATLGLDNTAFSAELTAEAVAVSAEPDVVLNEVSAGNHPGFFLELVNRRSTEMSLTGYVLRRSGAVNSTFAFPDVTLPAGGLRAFTATELGFQPAVNDQLILVVSGGNSIADAVIVTSASQGRFPDATGPWLFPAQTTPGNGNRIAFQHDVVINEILYHPRDIPSSVGAWVELFNRGTNEANLSGWRFSHGIDFRFPPGASIPPGGYLVVAENVGRMHSHYPEISVTGPYTNTLSHRSDRLVLSDASGNPADEVQYFDAGRWPAQADGTGSSLELRNPWADRLAAESWAASREFERSGWSNYTYRAIAVGSPGPTLWKEFVVGLLDAGECLIDDCKVVESPAGTPVSLLQNGSFENGATGWRFLGTHRHSAVIPDPDNPTNHVLHLIATGPTEHMHNHLETTLVNSRSVVNGREYQVSFRAKWLEGHPQLNTRLYFNRVARTTVLAAPTLNGTPGVQNSVYEPNIGPSFARLQHTPSVPAPNQPVTVSVEVSDPQGVREVRLFWSVNGALWNSIPLSMENGSPVLGTIMGAAAGSIVQFYVQATDGLGAISVFPAAGPDSGALYIVNDQRARPGPLHNLRIIMTKSNSSFLHALTNVMSNELLRATVVDNEEEVFYDVGVHLQGSERGRSDGGRVGFTLQFQADHLFRGVHDGISIDRSGGYTGVGADQDEILLKHALQHAGGLPGMYDDLVRVIPLRADLTGPGLLVLAKYGNVFLDSQYANGSAGSEFKLELVYFPTTTVGGGVQGLKVPQPDDVLGVDIGNLGDDPEVYRWFFLQDNNRSQNDYSPLITLAKALSKSGTAQDAAAHQLMDVNMWMRAVAFQTLWGLVDAYPFDNQHNIILYFRPEDGRALPFLWDMDYNFGAATTAPLNRAQGNIARLINMPGNQRLYLGNMLDIITTTYNTTYLTPWINHFGSLVGENFSGIRTYVDQRVKSVRSQLPPGVPFAVTSNAGQDILVDTPSVVLTGRAWINIKDLALSRSAGPLEFKWTTTTTWQTTAPLILGPNRLNFLALDFQGQLVGSNAITVVSSAVGGGVDQDGDGMPDVWELDHGLNPEVRDANLDPDHDGQTNLQEYLAGTDPWDPGSVLKLDAVQTAEGVHVTLMARAGRSYTIFGCDALSDAKWERVMDVDTQMTNHPVDALEAGPNLRSLRFYRVVTPRLL